MSPGVHDAGSPLLEVRGLVKRFGAVLATDQLDLVVHPQEIHALIGPNGAGKTSLIAQLAGSLTSDRGSIVFEGQDITRLPAHQRVRRGLVRSFQITRLFPGFSVRENIALAVQATRGSSLAFWRPVSQEAALWEQADRVLAEVGLADRAMASCESLSHGEQRCLEVAIALATEPKLLLLDEPLAGTGATESERMVRLIASLRGRLTILLVEHDMDAVFQLADRVSVLVGGRVIASAEPERIRRDPAVIEAYLGDEVTP